MIEVLTEPLPAWKLMLALVMIYWFRWRPNDRARRITAERLEDLERRLPPASSQRDGYWR